MKTTHVLTLAGLLLAGWTPAICGTSVVRDVAGLQVESVMDSEAKVAIAEVSLAAPKGLIREKVGFAAIEFEAPLPEGTIVELWVAGGDDAPLPWLGDTKMSGRKIQHWVVDKATGTWVRLDVTRVLRELAGTAAARKLYVRVLDDEGEPRPCAFAAKQGLRLTIIPIH
jgi:hypothetical protein